MSNLFIITGPAGVGKSTVSKKIAELRNKSALIEGDEIYHQVVGGYVSPWKEGNHLELFWKICIDTITNYLDSGYDVVFNYIVDIDNLENLKKIFAKCNIKFVVLIVDEDILLKRDKERPLDWQMGDRCIVLLNSFKNKGYSDDNVLDTSNISIDKTVDIILNEDRFII